MAASERRIEPPANRLRTACELPANRTAQKKSRLRSGSWAEGAGFEPTDQETPVSGVANSLLYPLSYSPV